MSALSPEALALKVATRALIEAAGGNEGAGATCGVRHQFMSDCRNPATDRFLRIHEVAALEDVTAGSAAHPAVTQALAKRQGFELVRLPDAAAPGGSLIEQLLQLATEQGELSAAVRTALGDGRCCPDDARKVLPEVEQLLSVGAAMRFTLQAIVREGQ